MLNRRGFQIILALVVVAVISSLLWFSSNPASAMTIDINNLSTATVGNSSSFDVVLTVGANDVLPVGSVNLDIYDSLYGPSSSYLHDTFVLNPDPNAYPSYTTVYNTLSTDYVSVQATDTNWGQGSGVERYGYGSSDGSAPTAIPFGYGSGWGYASSPYNGTATLTYHISWTVPSGWAPDTTYIAKVTVGNTGYANIVQSQPFTISGTYNGGGGGGGGVTSPTFGSFYPASGGTGTSVVINGTNLNYVTAVYFGSTQAQSFTVNSAYQITAITGSGSTGSITLYSSAGNVSSTSYFTFTTTQPTVSYFAPTSSASGGSVTITGSSFSGTTAVSFGGVAAQSFTVNSDTQITAIVGNGASGSVSVTNYYGTGTLAGFTFTGTGVTIDTTGTFTQTVTVPSPDSKAIVTIPSGVKGTVNGAPITQVTVAQASNIQSLPAGIQAVGLTYDFEPTGTTFSSPVTISLTYDPSLLPQGVSESSLYMAWFDVANNVWVNLPSTVDTVNKKITAQVNHFTNFAVLAGTSPATFGVSTLQITPAQAIVGKDVTISVLLVNDGSLSGDHNVVLQINGNPVATKSATVAGKSQQTVSFTVNENAPGTYNVIIDYLTGSFTVVSAPAVSATTTAPSPSITAPISTPTVSQPVAATPPISTLPITTTPPPKPASTNWPLIIGAIVVFILVIFVVYRVIVIQRKS